MDNTADLRVLLGSRHPLLFIESQDEGRLLTLLRDAVLALRAWARERAVAA